MDDRDLDLAVSAREYAAKSKSAKYALPEAPAPPEPPAPPEAPEPPCFEKHRLTRNSVSGKTIHYTWGSVDFGLEPNGKIVRRDGKPKSSDDSYWRVNPEGELEILHSDHSTVTKSFTILRTPDGLYGFGTFMDNGSPVFLRLDLPENPEP